MPNEEMKARALHEARCLVLCHRCMCAACEDRVAAVILAAEERGKREAAERLLQLISGGIGLMNHSEQQQAVSRWWMAVLPELEPDDKGRL